ncbi:hypothetical protein SCALM49S_09114 [Streptomyces californicus]
MNAFHERTSSNSVRSESNPAMRSSGVPTSGAGEVSLTTSSRRCSARGPNWPARIAAVTVAAALGGREEELGGTDGRHQARAPEAAAGVTAGGGVSAGAAAHPAQQGGAPVAQGVQGLVEQTGGEAAQGVGAHGAQRARHGRFEPLDGPEVVGHDRAVRPYGLRQQEVRVGVPRGLLDDLVERADEVERRTSPIWVSKEATPRR